MKRMSSFVFALALAMAASSTAVADDDVETEFYDFENMLIEGDFVSPDLQHMEAQGNAQFDRLLDLQTSFIPRVEESTGEPSLR